MYGDNGKFLVKGIFYEMSTPDSRAKYPPLFTLKSEPAHGLPSAYQVYMSSVDEYEAAIKIAGNMKNWRLLEQASWFLNGAIEVGHEGLEQWRADIEARDKSTAKQQLKEAAEGGNVAAMKTLYGTGKVKTSGKTRADIKHENNKVTSLTERMKGK